MRDEESITYLTLQMGVSIPGLTQDF